VSCKQIAAVRDLLTKGATEWTKAEVAAAFKGPNKADVEEVLDSLAVLGILAAYESRGTRRWKSTRAGREQTRIKGQVLFRGGDCAGQPGQQGERVHVERVRARARKTGRPSGPARYTPSSATTWR
jgi:hypothetical protein